MQVARDLLMSCGDLETAPRHVLHDRGTLLARDVDAVLTGAEVKVVKRPFPAPDANAHPVTCGQTDGFPDTTGSTTTCELPPF